MLHYVNKRFKPKFMINLATLTGAILVALGNHHAGLFSNSDELAALVVDCVRDLRGFFDFLKHYQEAAMELRTGIHPVIGAGIQRKIEKYDDHVHLISVGDAHVKVNPLYRYIQPPVGTFGVADENSL